MSLPKGRLTPVIESCYSPFESTAAIRNVA
jgi:hypothetical protein